MKRMTTGGFTALPLALVMTVPIMAMSHMAMSQDVGISQADLPNYSGAFSIENKTGVTIRYLVRWGNTNAWKAIVLGNDQIETHSYPLGSDRHGRAPTPYVRFDAIGGDGGISAKEYRMEFYAVGYAGYGPATNRALPKRYLFKYGADGRTLDILAR
jgi:hypothetical protein